MTYAVYVCMGTNNSYLVVHVTINGNYGQFPDLQ